MTEMNKMKLEDVMRSTCIIWAENELKTYDMELWLDLIKRTYLQSVTLAAGGIVAYYPTQVPYHRRSDYLGDADPFGDMVKRLRDMGIRITARTDPHAIHQEAFDAHPEWIAVDAQGNKRRHWARKDLWVTCTLGSYSFDHMNEIHKEIMRNYSVDSIFINRWGGSGACYCENCRQEFRKVYGMELPEPGDHQSLAYLKHRQWVRDTMVKLWQHWDSEIRKVNPSGILSPNMGHEQYLMDMKTIGEMAASLGVDKQGRSGNEPMWLIGRSGKRFRSILGNKPVSGGFSVGPEVRYRWKDAVQSDAELRTYYADAIANGLRTTWGKFSTSIYDKRWIGTIEDIFSWCYRNEKYLKNERSLAEVALLYSQPKVLSDYNGEGGMQMEPEDHSLGMYHAMVEARIPFDIVHDQLMDAECLDRYKLLILPNNRYLSDEQCRIIREYAARGGSVLATYETSLYRESGEKRADFGLSDVFGVKFIRNQPGPVKNSYIRLERGTSDGRDHSIIKGFEGAMRIMNGVWQLEVEAQETFKDIPLTLIPQYPDLPMEDCYPRIVKTDIPQVYLKEQEKNRIVYFPWDIDRVYWELTLEDHGRLLQNAVLWALEDNKQVEVKGKGILDVTVWEQKESMTVHLVNITNPMMMKGFCKEIIPVGEQRLKIRIPEGRCVKRVHFLVDGREADFELCGRDILVTVPQINVHEVVAVDF